MVTRWEYCMLSNPTSATASVNFTHTQRDTLVQDFTAHLGMGLFADSTTGYLHLNLAATNLMTVAGWLGNEGWELVSHTVLPGSVQYFAFKREYQR